MLFSSLTSFFLVENRRKLLPPLPFRLKSSSLFSRSLSFVDRGPLVSSFTMASSARALSAAAATLPAAASFATRASVDTHRSMSMRRRGRCAPNILAQLPALPSASADRPSTSGRRTSGLPQRGRGAHQRPLSRPPAAEKGSPSTTPNGSAPLAPGTRIAQLPLFPLNLVAFPHADVPLHIFEAR